MIDLLVVYHHDGEVHHSRCYPSTSLTPQGAAYSCAEFPLESLVETLAAWARVRCPHPLATRGSAQRWEVRCDARGRGIAMRRACLGQRMLAEVHGSGGTSSWLLLRLVGPVLLPATGLKATGFWTASMFFGELVRFMFEKLVQKLVSASISSCFFWEI